MKLNMGSGMNRVGGFVNVDKMPNPGIVDVVHDLEVFPWPWPGNSAEAVVFYHSLEHMGQQADVFIGIMKELYRICAPGARIQIDVPHPRHDNFIGDPTHVRAVTPEMLALFSRKRCKDWVARKCANTPLALYHGIDFEVREVNMTLSGAWEKKRERGELDERQLRHAMLVYNNVVRDVQIILEAVK